MNKIQPTIRTFGLGALTLAACFLVASAAEADPQAARSRSSASASSARSSSVGGGSSAARSAPSASRSASPRGAAVTRSTGRSPAGPRTRVSGTSTHRRPGHGRHTYGRYTGSPYRYYPYYYGHYPYYGFSPYYGLSFGLGWWGSYYYSPYYSFHYSYPPSYYSYYGRRAAPARVEVEPVGAFDLAVKPKKTEVWVDGRYVGTAGRFDGFPDYLWLDEGEHQIVFYLEGHATVERQVETLAGVVSELAVTMEPGRAIPPRQLAMKPVPPPTLMERRPAPPASGDADSAEAPAVQAPPGALDLRPAPGRLVLTVEPGDASVYLDGRYLGTGRDLARLHAGLLIDSGDHRLEIVRPGYADRAVDFSIAAGEEERIEIGLESG